ncbi:MAG: hypothetical protein UU39_C0033G0004 [Candidatus Woesebacteria bacterium GW2011_GWD1_41_12]|uniref:Uncharacterized protein n=3 Tax=Candidatus Woeseibacteriota TaxID=1752722 RepID=A0A0G0UL65_9BACT|nr:MAG: hypothetical protein UU39_C0033G0004 [Candidatus Woesebacteria bacterium GW2011_GWD1_41_12]
MKLIAKILLVLISIPVILMCLLSINIRLQFLSSGFWISAFEKGDVYIKTSSVIENKLITRVVAEGGKESDVTVLSGLISPSSLKYFFENNIDSLLLFANGKSLEMMVYVPLTLSDALEGNDYYNLENFSEKMTMTEFLEKFNVIGVNASDLQMISRLGIWSWAFVAVSFILLVIIIFLMYRLTQAGKRLVAPAVPLILSAILIIGASYAGKFGGRVLAEGFTGSPNIGTSLAAIITPPVIRDVAKIWIIFGASLFILGVLLLFIKKPLYNSRIHKPE